MTFTQRVLTTLLVIGATVPVAAQVPFLYPNPPWCPTCYIEANVDAPASGSLATISTAPWASYVAGWAFQCTTGENPQRYEVAITQNGSSTFATNVVIANNLARPDVWQHFYNAQSHCTLSGTPGFHLYFPNGLPGTPGSATLTINLWYGGMLNSQARNVILQ